VLEEPLSHTWIRRHLATASIYSGFEEKMIGSVLRRGAAYLLKMHASPEERRLRMGHLPGSNTYEKYYMNKTSTLDMQALRTGVQVESLEMMSAISTGRRTGRASEDL
jgi:hypothetical protein